MQAFKRVASLVARPNAPLVFRFSSDKWKDRDEAAERVYVTQQESTLCTMQRRPSRSC